MNARVNEHPTEGKSEVLFERTSEICRDMNMNISLDMKLNGYVHGCKTEMKD